MVVLPVGEDTSPLYTVFSESGREYLVNLRAERCECPDYRKRGVVCKHQRRARLTQDQRRRDETQAAIAESHRRADRRPGGDNYGPPADAPAVPVAGGPARRTRARPHACRADRGQYCRRSRRRLILPRGSRPPSTDRQRCGALPTASSTLDQPEHRGRRVVGSPRGRPTMIDRHGCPPSG